MSFRIFAAEIVFESAFPGAQQTQSVPTASTRVLSQHRRVSGSDDRKVDILSEMMSNAIVAVDPGGTHRTSLGLFLSKHELINHKRTIGRREQLTHANFSDRFVAIVERSRTFKELVILNGR